MGERNNAASTATTTTACIAEAAPIRPVPRWLPNIMPPRLQPFVPHPPPALDPHPLPVHGHQEHGSPVAFRCATPPAAFAVAIGTVAGSRTKTCLRRRRDAAAARPSEVQPERSEGGEVRRPNFVEGQHVLRDRGGAGEEEFRGFSSQGYILANRT